MTKPKKAAKHKAVPKPKQLLKLDLGCGDNPRPGFDGVDIAKTKSVKYVWDLTKTPWPFKDESVEEAYSQHFFEHLDGTERFKFMDELYRVLAPEGKCSIVTPYWSSMRAIQDPTHKWPPVCEQSYFYFSEAWRYVNSLEHYPVSCNFDFSYGFNFDPEIFNKAEEVRRHNAKFYVNAVSDVFVTVVKKPRLTKEEKAKLPVPKIGNSNPGLSLAK